MVKAVFVMPASIKEFGETAKSLAHNPLGIIALFLVLVYGCGCLVTMFNRSLTQPYERLPLIYFVVVFPVLVLAIFAWLVSKHSGKLFAPSDFKNEENYVRMQFAAVASLAAASAKNQDSVPGSSLDRIIEVVRRTNPTELRSSDGWRRRVLWVDDRPENNVYERQAFQAIGIEFTLALSTQDALARIAQEKYAAIISDMGRKEGPREGYVLLDELRRSGDRTPFFIYAGSRAPEHRQETVEHGGQGCTNNPQELFQMVTRAVLEHD
jgi:CheY-like chemotaxis protein